MKILVVDDEVEVADFLCNFLNRLGLSAEKAICGKDALEIFNHYKPDWVFLDINMPDINGLQLLKKMREIDADVKAIIITGKNDDSTENEAQAIGASDYLIKPIDLEGLLKIIKKHIPIKE